MKIAKLRATPEFLISFCKGYGIKPRIQITENALPDDAELYRVEYEKFGNTIFLILRSESFDDISEGGNIPEIPAPVWRVVE